MIFERLSTPSSSVSTAVSTGPLGDSDPRSVERVSLRISEADDGVRTRDPQLGKLMLYQLSYVRASFNDSVIRTE